MLSLASIDDVRSLGVEGTDALIQASLAKASARFRSEARHHITAADYNQVLPTWGGSVALPVAPVIRVDSVKMIELDGTDGAPVVGYFFDGIRTISAGNRLLVINGPGYLSRNIRVEYRAGYDPVPEDARWCVASMVERALTSVAAPGIASETIAEYTWRAGGYTASGALSMSRDELAIAHSYRERVRTVSLGQG
jgi:hypothetical protein